jgi:hypothetical protein
VPTYVLVCVLLGLAIGWWPALFHGPIPYKYDILGMRGATAVWGWYTARLLIGLLVGVTAWPRPWWLRGPLCGLVLMFPLSIVSLATPGCMGACMFWNDLTASVTGLVIAGIARAVTGRDHL